MVSGELYLAPGRLAARLNDTLVAFDSLLLPLLSLAWLSVVDSTAVSCKVGKKQCQRRDLKKPESNTQLSNGTFLTEVPASWESIAKARL